MSRLITNGSVMSQQLSQNCWRLFC